MDYGNNSANLSNSSTEDLVTEHFSLKLRITLVIIYSVVLLGGTAGIFTMGRYLMSQQNKLSITTTSIINLIVAHGLFLFTVPFRLDYYVTSVWRYPFVFCRLVSISVHTHLYICCFFYIAILVVRALPYFKYKPWVFRRNISALVFSLVVWFLFSFSVYPALWINYGQTVAYDLKKCFEFQSEIKNYVVVLNFVVAGVVMSASATVIAAESFVILKMVRRSQGKLLSQQEFRAQMKNMSFVLIMVVCHLPYHIFRIHYVQNVNSNVRLVHYNEVFLSITSLCCLDLLIFFAI